MSEYISPSGLAYTVDNITSKMETLDKENLAKTEYMCRNLYEQTKQDIRDVYHSLNWVQRLLWRILGLNRLWEE